MLYYYWPEDDWFSGGYAGLTFSGTIDVGYPIANVGNSDPANPFKTIDLYGNIDLDLGSTRVIQNLAIIHSNLIVAHTDVRFQISTVSNYSSLVADAAVTIPDYQEDGQPENAFCQLTAAVNGRYIRIHMGSSGGQVDPLSIGEIVVGGVFRGLPFQPSVTSDESHPNIKNVSEGGGVTTIYIHGYRLRWLRGTFRLSTLNGISSSDDPVRRWRRAAQDDSRPFLIREANHEPMYVFFEKPTAPRKRSFESSVEFLDDYPGEFVEASRGLIP